MAEYIERDKLSADFELCNKQNPRWTPQRVASLIARANAADVAPVVHGRWELEGGDDDLDLYGWCSVCNRHWHEDLIDKFNYCPNCGARMDGE